MEEVKTGQKIFFNNNKYHSPYHPDIWLFMLLIPFISAFNYYLTYVDIRFNGFLILTYTIDTVQGYLAWLGVRAFILYLDKKMPYAGGAAKRIAAQLPGTIIIGIAIISLLTELTSWIAKGKPAPLSFYFIDIFIISIWFFVINGIYIGLHFYNEWKKLEASRSPTDKTPPPAGIVVRQGKQDLLLSYSDIAGFYVDENYVVIAHIKGQKYYLDLSLDKLEKTLPPDDFFRLNRQYLIHRQMIPGFRREDNGKLLVFLREHKGFPSEIPVSRTKAPAFKSWFRPQ